jgi:hypothetical protein
LGAVAVAAAAAVVMATTMTVGLVVRDATVLVCVAVVAVGWL